VRSINIAPRDQEDTMPMPAPTRREGERRRDQRRVEMSPSAVGGALTAGAAAGLTLGPIGAIAGLVVGGIGGELLDRYVDARQHESPRPPARKVTHR